LNTEISANLNYLLLSVDLDTVYEHFW